jgi:alkanesulfonate monooxygenase SsuD/methylene tetrahydromethanopterin reductase-like flavin-dependent oxidoreductase (luciferase family)
VPHPLRFQVLLVPNIPMADVLARFDHLEALGVEVGAMADHFCDWSTPSNSWFEGWTTLAAVAARTSTIRLTTCVTQIPLRNPGMVARQALTIDHVSNGRFELGLGTGLTIDPSYDMIGLPNWSAGERVDRFAEYVEIVDRMLTNPVSSYTGRFYEIREATMHPGPVQTPRPPIMVGALAPRMLRLAARHADIWNSLSFLGEVEAQLTETRQRVAVVDDACAAIGRDPGTLRRSYTMFDAEARPKGGAIGYYESTERFVDAVERVIELGMSEIGLYYPMDAAQLPMFEAIATEVMPALRARYTDGI